LEYSGPLFVVVHRRRLVVSLWATHHEKGSHPMKIISLGTLLLLSCAFSSPAKGDGNNLGLAYLYGYGGLGGIGWQSYTPAPPYFALHPPVYYGQRFTRPYGVSPFAAWPQLQPNAAYAPQAHVERAPAIRSETICNPYVPADAATAPVTGVVTSAAVKPLELDNPYFRPEQVLYTAQSANE
jgi:hypothetical protein